MSRTVQDVLSEVQEQLIEDVDGGASWASGHWDVYEVQEYLRRRYAAFLKDTRVVTERVIQGTVPEEPRQQLPQNWQLNIRVAWHPSATSPTIFSEVVRADTVEIDLMAPADGYQPGVPVKYATGEIPPPALEFYPPAANAGEMELFFIGIPSAYNPDTGIFEPLPDDLLYALKYGTMADMLGKVGRGQDLARAEYCEQRYQEGVTFARMMAEGPQDT